MLTCDLLLGSIGGNACSSNSCSSSSLGVQDTDERLVRTLLTHRVAVWRHVLPHNFSISARCSGFATNRPYGRM